MLNGLYVNMANTGSCQPSAGQRERDGGGVPGTQRIAEDQQMSEVKGSILMGMIWMFIISLLLIWLPGLGPLIAGIVGGKVAGGAYGNFPDIGEVAGGVMRGILAALLPGILLAGSLFVFGSVFTGLPFVGAVIAGGGILLYVLYVPVLLIGALIGGLLA